jgi:hypothetical protein
MKLNIPIHLFLIGLTACTLTACKKYLDAKPNLALTTPTSTEDLQALLDNNIIMNRQCDDAAEVVCDNYYLNDAGYNAMPFDAYRSFYLWKSDMFKGILPTITPWAYGYNIAYYANVVLDNIDNVDKSSGEVAWNNCKGSALFFRAKSFWEVAQVFAKAYDNTTATTDLGIALRLTSDFNIKSTRATMQQTYDRIITDLTTAIPLLPKFPTSTFRPGKAACYGMLARVYLSMRDYQKAGLYADSCLQINSTLLNYSTVGAGTFPFASLKLTNPEIIFYSITLTRTDVNTLYAKIDSALFKQYDINDYRRSKYFKINTDGSAIFIGSYYGGGNKFNGLAVDEMYLTRAECFARNGNANSAMNDLNALLQNRYKTGTFVPLTATDPTDALNKILTERRKELVMRTLRYTDLKRLNKEGANITVVRFIKGQTYTLQPNDPRYALPIPDDVIQASGMPQN